MVEVLGYTVFGYLQCLFLMRHETSAERRCLSTTSVEFGILVFG